MDDEHPQPRPRYGVYPLVGDQVRFRDELYSGNDKVAGMLAAKRHAKDHPLGVILYDQKTANGWVWRDMPPLKGYPVQIEVNVEDIERHFKDWAERYLRQHRQ